MRILARAPMGGRLLVGAALVMVVVIVEGEVQRGSGLPRHEEQCGRPGQVRLPKFPHQSLSSCHAIEAADNVSAPHAIALLFHDGRWT